MSYSAYSHHVIPLTRAGPPDDITLGAIETSSMTLTWGTPQNDSTDGTILNYLVQCNSMAHAEFALTLTRPAAADRVAMLRNLRPYVSYNCCVAVQTDTAVSPFSCVAQYTLEEGKKLYHDTLHAYIFPLICSTQRPSTECDHR